MKYVSHNQPYNGMFLDVGNTPRIYTPTLLPLRPSRRARQGKRVIFIEEGLCKAVMALPTWECLNIAFVSIMHIFPTGFEGADLWWDILPNRM